MGLTISAKGYKNSLDCGYFGFNFLRCEIALSLFPEFGEKYKAYFGTCNEDERTKIWEDVCSIANPLIKSKTMKVGFAKFMVASDCKHSLSVPATLELWDQIKDLEIDIKFGYQGQEDCATFSDFKNLVKWCAKRCLIWY